MARVELPQSKLRRRRRRRRLLALCAIALVLALLIAGAAWLSRAPFLKIGAITVSGAQSIATSSIEEFVHSRLAGSYLWLFPRDNIFLYPRAAIAAGLLQRYPELRQAEVHA